MDDGVNHFKLKLLYHNLKYLRFSTSGCKYIGYQKSEFVANTQFLSKLYERNTLGKSKIQKETSTPAARPHHSSRPCLRLFP